MKEGKREGRGCEAISIGSTRKGKGGGRLRRRKRGASGGLKKMRGK